MDEIEIKDITLSELKTWCARLNLPTHGTKATLIKILNQVPAIERGFRPAKVDGDKNSNDEENTTEKSDATQKCSNIFNDDNDGAYALSSGKADNYNKNDGNDEETGADAHNEILQKLQMLMRKEDDGKMADDVINKGGKEIKKVVLENDSEDKFDSDINADEFPIDSSNANSNATLETNSNATLEYIVYKLQRENEKLRSNSFDIPFNTIKECVPEYNGEDDINDWLQCVQNVREVFKVKNEIMRPLICSRIKGKANLWLLSKTSLLSSDIDDMLMQLKTMFGSKDNILEIRRKFEQRATICIVTSGPKVGTQHHG
ncbi:hypothetical protein ACLKA6_009751 [Drosophila palustris]